MFDRIVRVGILLGVVGLVVINVVGFFMSPIEFETTLRPLTDAELASMPPLPPVLAEKHGLVEPVPYPPDPDPPAPKSMALEFGTPGVPPSKRLIAIGRPYAGSIVLLHGDRVEIDGRECTIDRGDDNLAWLRPGFPPDELPPVVEPLKPVPHGPPTDDAAEAFRDAVGDTVANGAHWNWCDFPPYWVVSFGSRTFHVRAAPTGWDVWERLMLGDQPQVGDRAPELPPPPSDDDVPSAMLDQPSSAFSLASLSKQADGSAADAYEVKRQQEAEFLKMQSGRYLLAPIDGTPMLCIFDQWSGMAFAFQGTGISRSRKVIETGWPKPVDSSEIDRLKKGRSSEFMKSLERSDAEKVEVESAP